MIDDDETHRRNTVAYQAKQIFFWWRAGLALQCVLLTLGFVMVTRWQLDVHDRLWAEAWEGVGRPDFELFRVQALLLAIGSLGMVGQLWFISVASFIRRNRSDGPTTVQVLISALPLSVVGLGCLAWWLAVGEEFVLGGDALRYVQVLALIGVVWGGVCGVSLSATSERERLLASRTQRRP